MRNQFSAQPGSWFSRGLSVENKSNILVVEDKLLIAMELKPPLLSSRASPVSLKAAAAINRGQRDRFHSNSRQLQVRTGLGKLRSNRAKVQMLAWVLPGSRTCLRFSPLKSALPGLVQAQGKAPRRDRQVPGMWGRTTGDVSGQVSSARSW